MPLQSIGIFRGGASVSALLRLSTERTVSFVRGCPQETDIADVGRWTSGERARCQATAAPCRKCLDVGRDMELRARDPWLGVLYSGNAVLLISSSGTARTRESSEWKGWTEAQTQSTGSTDWWTPDQHYSESKGRERQDSWRETSKWSGRKVHADSGHAASRRTSTRHGSSGRMLRTGATQKRAAGELPRRAEASRTAVVREPRE